MAESCHETQFLRSVKSQLNSTLINFTETLNLMPTETENETDNSPYQCYEWMNEDETAAFHAFERNLGGYALCIVGLLGITGNLLNLVVLSHKEMRTNCFNQLLIGK